MNASVYVTGAVMATFMLAATGWSLARATRGGARWRLVHLAIALSMIGGAFSVYMNQGGSGMLLGIVLLVLSLAVMLIDKSPGRWPVLIEFISGAILASGILFRAP